MMMEVEYEKAIGLVNEYVRCRNIERANTSMEHCIKLGKYFMAKVERRWCRSQWYTTAVAIARDAPLYVVSKSCKSWSEGMHQASAQMYVGVYRY